MTAHPTDLERAFAAFVERHALIPPGDPVIAAVSGGVDSMVLLGLLDGLRRAGSFDLSVAHVNHRLRGADSDLDEAVVRDAAVARGLPFHLHRCDLPGNGPSSGIQERARAERYRFFAELRETSPRSRVATAHHRDDNAETVLFNFLRGTGVRGLRGIPLRHDDGAIIRPLLFATRARILAHAAATGTAWREDASNATTKYTRNAIRRMVIPAIEEAVNPSVRETLARTSELFADLDLYVSAEVDRILPGLIRPGEGLRLDAAGLAALPLFMRESVLLAAAKRCGAMSAGFHHVRTMVRLAEARPGSSCLVLKDLHATRERDCLVLRNDPPVDESFEIPVREGEAYAFSRFTFSSTVPDIPAPSASPWEECVDASKLGGELRLRSWREGDWFVPIGLGARKKLSDYFIDRKITPGEKDRIPLLVSGEEIVWVCGERLDDRFRLTPSTTRALLLRYRPVP